MAWVALAAGVVSGLMGKNSAQSAKNANWQSSVAQQNAARQAGNLYAPYAQMGQQAVGDLQQSGTYEGMNNDLGQIMQGGAYQNLVGERQRASEAMMAARGLRRSGAAVQEAANIPTNVALGLENEMRRRREQQAGMGLQAAGGQAGAIMGGGQAQAAGFLGNAQIDAQRNQQYANLIGQGLGAFGNGGFSFGGGGGQGSPGSNPNDYTGNAMAQWVAQQNGY